MHALTHARTHARTHASAHARTASQFIDTDRTGELERSEIKGLIASFNIHDVSAAAMDDLIQP